MTIVYYRYHSPFTIHHSPFTIHYSLFTILRSSTVFYCLLLSSTVDAISLSVFIRALKDLDINVALNGKCDFVIPLNFAPSNEHVKRTVIFPGVPLLQDEHRQDVSI
ncbi:hypothetical protein [Vibrio methylphosphonaticus]|uniref:hypothetical protein n=1 Tax=Vibrio methylphosphonaticus TaxID=2946866 RepID=UPI00202AB49F|nr:hypothetical protein [Vibrio methylphosphonaticus]MCL9773122.1 hypothetical protein [Vibrio methylphosphonaticus]